MYNQTSHSKGGEPDRWARGSSDLFIHTRPHNSNIQIAPHLSAPGHPFAFPPPFQSLVNPQIEVRDLPDLLVLSRSEISPTSICPFLGFFCDWWPNLSVFADAMATVSALTCNIIPLGSSASSVSSNAISAGSSNSPSGLRPLPLRLVPRRGSRAVQRRQRRVCYQGPSALFDRGTEGSDGKKPERKFITKEEEPQQYWQAADEREGKSPMSSPLPYILMLSVISPFLIMAVAFANGWIKIPVR